MKNIALLIPTCVEVNGDKRLFDATSVPFSVRWNALGQNVVYTGAVCIWFRVQTSKVSTLHCIAFCFSATVIQKHELPSIGCHDFFWRRSCRCQIKRVTFSLYSGQQYKTSNLELRSFPLSKLTWWRVNGPNNGLFYFYLAFLVMPSTKIVCLWYTQSLRQTEIKCYFATEMFRYSVCILGTFTVYLPEIKQ